MAKIGNVPEINAIKEHLDALQKEGALTAWELPYENLLTRLGAAIFFLSPISREFLPKIWHELSRYGQLKYRLNEERKLSTLDWRVEFGDGCKSD